MDKAVSTKKLKVLKTECGDYVVVQEVFSEEDVKFLRSVGIEPRWVKSC